MRKLLVTTAALLVAVPPATAGSPPPEVTILGVRGPVTGPSGDPEWLVDVEARDPDGIVTSVDLVVRGRALSHADTGACFLGTPGRGETVRMSVGVSFPRPGRYSVQAIATSYPDCVSNDHQDSAPDTVLVEVR